MTNVFSKKYKFCSELIMSDTRHLYISTIQSFYGNLI